MDHQQYPPPPPESGAGQKQDVPLAGLHVPQHSDEDDMYTQNNIPQNPSHAPYPDSSNYPPPPPNPGQPAYTSENTQYPPPPSHQDQSAYHSENTQFSSSPIPGKEQQYQHDVPFQQTGFQQPSQAGQYEHAPPMPPRPSQQGASMTGGLSPYNPATYNQGSYAPPPPPRRISQSFGEDDPSDPIHYTRDPHKLVAYLVPFPKPQMKDVDPAKIPDRFLIYTPPPPPLGRPKEGEKESKAHKVQRKWQEEVRHAKTSTAKTASWQGVKGKATKGISKAMSYTTTSNLDFLGRFAGNKSDSEDGHGHDGVEEGDTTHKTVGVDEMLLVYPSTMGLNHEQMREEFVSSMLRSKTKAQRDAVIATGLMPVAFGIDVLATLVWPFGGLAEIDGVWAYSSMRGAKTARSVTKRLTSTSTTGDHDKDQLHLNFVESQRLEVLKRYLEADCHKADQRLFPGYVLPPTETDVLEAIGWSPRQTGGESNWEDEQWEMTEVKEDLKTVMRKGAKEWKKWCTAFAKDPEKAMKK